MIFCEWKWKSAKMTPKSKVSIGDDQHEGDVGNDILGKKITFATNYTIIHDY